MRKKTGGRVKGTPNKLTATIKEQLGNLADEVLESIDINLFSKAEKIKLLFLIKGYIFAVVVYKLYRVRLITLCT